MAALQRATLCADARGGAADRMRPDAWLERRAPRLAYRPENRGCGCRVDPFDVEAPAEAPAELPARFFAARTRSGDADGRSAGPNPSSPTA